MNRIFGKAKVEPVKPAPYAGPSLNETSQNMDKRVLDIDAKIAKCDEDIKSAMAQRGGKLNNSGSKQRAVQALKRKKMLTQQRDQLMATQFNVDQMAFSHENAQMQVQTIGAMTAGMEAMKQTMKDIDVDKVADQMDDMQDMMMDMEEINDMMGRNYACDGVDDAELEAEFGAIEEELKLEQYNSMITGEGSVPSYLPAAMAKPVAEAASSGTPVAESEISWKIA